MPTSHFWREWEGHTIAGQYRLNRLWGNTEQTAVFTSDQKVIKLISPEAAGPGEPFDRFARIRELSHPHLMPLLEYGVTSIGEQDWYYIITEQANDDLSKLVAERPLDRDEAREVLRGILSALEYLHAQGFVHGSLKPSNILLVEDCLKISSDQAQSLEQAKPKAGKPMPFDPPEFAQGEMHRETDVWQLGVLLVTSLTRSETPLSGAADGLSEPFSSIVRGCLRKDPASRLTLAQIEDHLAGRIVPETAATRQLADVPATFNATGNVIPPMQMLPRLLLIAAAALVAVVCFAVLGGNGEQPQAASPPPAAPQAVMPAPVNTAPAAQKPEAKSPPHSKPRRHRRHK